MKTLYWSCRMGAAHVLAISLGASAVLAQGGPVVKEPPSKGATPIEIPGKAKGEPTVK